MLRYGIFVLFLAGTGYACVDLGERGARAVEALMMDRVATGLEAVDLDWAKLRADGLRLEMSGHAPDVFARDLALETARATAPMALVIDHMTASLAPPKAREPIAVEILRDGDGLTLTGRFYGPEMQAELVAALRGLAPDLPVHDLTGVNAARPGRHWGPELAVAALAAARLPNAFVRMTPGEVQVGGTVNGSDHRQAVALELLALAGERVTLILDLSEPPRVAVPFAFAAIKDLTGGFRLEACAARNAEELALLQTALTRHRIEVGADGCSVALGGPGGDWATAVVAGLEALERLPAGRFRLEYLNADLKGLAPTPEADFVAALAGLARALPKGYGLDGEMTGLPEQSAAIAPPYWMRLALAADGVALSGRVPGETAARVIETYAAARFGADRTKPALTVAEADAPPGWEAAILIALDVLNLADAGNAEILPDRISVTGIVDAPTTARRMHLLLAGEAPDGYAVETALTVNLPAKVAAVPLDPRRCAVLLESEVKAAPIDFAPGSAVIEGASRPVLNRLAAILKRCEDARIEIGGHTDSQGSDELNRRLSLARAEAVLDALMARDVALGQMVSRGYGDSQPVASNATETGRALNRRIAFTVVE